MARTPPQLQHVQLQIHPAHQVLPAIHQPPPMSPLKVQQAQHWVQQEGLESSIIDLVAYVDAVSAAKAKQAAHHEELMLGLQQQHQTSLQEQQLLHNRLQIQSQQLQEQAKELERLHKLQPTSDSHYNYLYRELEVQGRELASWRSKFQTEQQARDIAETGLKETTVVVDQLTEECAVVSCMLKDLHQLETATAGSTSPRAARQVLKGVAIKVAASLLLVGCTAAATFLATRAVIMQKFSN